MGADMRDRRITKRLVDSLKPTDCDRFVWDDTLIGFGVRVQRTGVKPTSSNTEPAQAAGRPRGA